MSDIHISLDIIEQMILDHIEHAGASLETQNPKWARRGLTAAAQAKTLAELVVNNAESWDSQVARISELHKQAARLLASYWEDFGIVLLKRTSTGEHTVVVAEPIDKPANGVNIRHLGKENPPHSAHTRRRRLPEELDVKLRSLIAGGAPSGVSRSAWFKTIAKDCGVAEQTVYNKEKTMIRDGEA